MSRVPDDVKEAVLVAADVCPYPGQVGDAINAYSEQGNRDMALFVFRAHAVLCLVELLYLDFEARVMREGLTEGGGEL